LSGSRFTAPRARHVVLDFKSLRSEVEEKQLRESVLQKDRRSVFPEERILISGKSARAPIALRAQLRGIRMSAPRTSKELKALLA
jgi:hypothetical protein